MKKSTTKRALLLSLVSLFVCFTMLMGTTFAWFTDSVTSANNIIASGNLDVELYHSDASVTDAVVDSNTKLFDDVELWEPGAMVWEEFTIANKGSLALKYQFTLHALRATEINGESFANMLKVAVVDETFTYDRASVEAIAADKWQSLATFTLPGELAAGTESEAFGIVIWWQPNADDNKFNVDDGTTVSVEIGVNLVATQLSAENDAFDNSYDKDAWVEGMQVLTADDLQTAVNSGATEIVLGDNIVLDEPIVIPAAASTYTVGNTGVVIDLNGKTLTAPAGALWAIQNMGTLTITGNGTIVGSYTALYSNGNLTIENGTFIATDGLGVMIDNIYGTEASVATINGGTFTGVGIYNPTEVTINGGTFNVGRDPDGASDYISDEMTLFISPTFTSAPNTANVLLNGGTFNGDVYVYDDGITETVFVNNGATITGDVLDNG